VKILALKDIWIRNEDSSSTYIEGSLERIAGILQDFKNLDVLILIDAQHRPENTRQLSMIMGDSNDQDRVMYSK